MYMYGEHKFETLKALSEYVELSEDTLNAYTSLAKESGLSLGALLGMHLERKNLLSEQLKESNILKYVKSRTGIPESEKPLVLVDGKKIYTIKELEQFLGLSYKAIQDRIKRSGSFEAWWREIEKHKFKIEGYTCYSHHHLHRYFESKGYGLSKTHALAIWGRLLKHTSYDFKIRELTTELEVRNKIALWFTNGSMDFNVSDYVGLFGVSRDYFVEAITGSKTRREFLFKFKRLPKSFSV